MSEKVIFFDRVHTILTNRGTSKKVSLYCALPPSLICFSPKETQSVYNRRRKVIKGLFAILGIFGLSGDSFEARVEKRLVEPSLRNDFVTDNPTMRTSGQGDVTFDSDMEIGADVAHCQERNYDIA